MSDDSLRQWIDTASYEDLLRRWRFAPVGSLFFVGEVGRYFEDTMKQRKAEIGNAEAVRVSKNLGWEG